MIHIYSSKVLLNLSITFILMLHILPHMVYYISFVKILLQVIDLNMVYKTRRTSKYIRNSDFTKNRDIRFSRDIFRSSAPYALFSPLYTYSYYYWSQQS